MGCVRLSDGGFNGLPASPVIKGVHIHLRRRQVRKVFDGQRGNGDPAGQETQRFPFGARIGKSNDNHIGIVALVMLRATVKNGRR